MKTITLVVLTMSVSQRIGVGRGRRPLWRGGVSRPVQCRCQDAG